LLIEEPDYGSWLADQRFSTEVIDKVRTALRTSVTEAGVDWQYGRHSLAMSRAAGLIDVDAEGRVVMEVPDSPQHGFTLLTFMQLRDRLIHAGLLSDAEADAYVAAYQRPDFLGMDATRISVWGRKLRDDDCPGTAQQSPAHSCVG
jgi:hypothetical protein